jgi:CBS domain-containing protein
MSPAELENISVADVMRTHIATISPETTLHSLVNDVLLGSDYDSVPVVAPGGDLVGIVSLADARSVAIEDWSVVPVRSVMHAVADTGSLSPTAPVRAALDTMARRKIEQLPVVADGRVLGLVSGRDIVKRLSLVH